VAIAYLQVIRGTPLLLQLFYIYYVLPFLGIELSPFVSGILGLAINYGAYMSEVYRAGILAIDKGQHEAAASLGMSKPHIMRRIILPQAVPLIVPPLGNYFVGMFKDSAVVSILTLNELLFTAQLLAKATYQSLLIFTQAAAIYFVISFPAVRLVNWMERRVKMDYSERRKPSGRQA
jgi:ABC-type amino acid transport system permease subunit